MDARTLGKIETIERAVRRRLSRWQKRYPGVIVGAHVGFKETAGAVKRRFSIVFHVSKKHAELPAQFHLPKYVDVTIPGRGEVRVPTDVIETGRAELDGLAPGMKVSQVAGSEFGTIGPLASSGSDVYLVSNMHVLGDSFLDRGETSVTILKDQQVGNIVLVQNGSRPIVASFARGRLNQFIDAGIARLMTPEDVDSSLPAAGGSQAGAPRGPRTLTTAEAMAGVPVHMAGAVSGVMSGTAINGNAMKVFQYPTGRLNLQSLIQIRPKISARGDSGSVIFDDQRNVLGILVGRDDAFSYAIPIETILRTFRVQLLTS